MYNYYELLNVDITSDNNNIKTNYKNIIKKYYNKYNLSFEEIKYIKIIKTGLHILSNNYLKNKYNILLFNTNDKQNDEPINKINNEENNESNNKLDESNNKVEEYKGLINNYNNNYENNNINDIFNIDNAWMKDIKTNDDDKKLDNNIINNRIFTLHNNKLVNNEIDNNIRKPLSCRENKKN